MQPFASFVDDRFQPDASNDVDIDFFDQSIGMCCACGPCPRSLHGGVHVHPDLRGCPARRARLQRKNAIAT